MPAWTSLRRLPLSTVQTYRMPDQRSAHLRLLPDVGVPAKPVRRSKQTAVAPEIIEIVARAPVTLRFARLAEFYGAGRKLTAKGYPTLADARQLVELLELTDRFDERYGNRVYRTTSAGDLPDLMFTVRWALKAGVVRKDRGRLVATASWAKYDTLRRFERSSGALLALGPLGIRFSDSWPFSRQLAGLVDETVPTLLAALELGPVDFEDSVDQLCAFLESHYSFGGPMADPGSRRRNFESDLDIVGEFLEVAGIVRRERDGDPPPAEDRYVHTPFGGWMVPTEAGAWWTAKNEFSDLRPQVFAPTFPGSGVVYELRVVLDGVFPPVERAVSVPSNLSLEQLHDVLQVSMGWEDYHLHEYVIHDRRFGIDDGEDWGEEFGGSLTDDRMVRLDSVAGVGDTFRYTYDFGDNWEHTVEVRSERRVEGADSRPRCTGGRGRCPPEDVGGTGGYAEFLEAVRDPAHEEHETMLTWAGGDFDPARFELDEVNAALASSRVSRWSAASRSRAGTQPQ